MKIREFNKIQKIVKYRGGFIITSSKAYKEILPYVCKTTASELIELEKIVILKSIFNESTKVNLIKELENKPQLAKLSFLFKEEYQVSYEMLLGYISKLCNAKKEILIFNKTKKEYENICNSKSINFTVNNVKEYLEFEFLNGNVIKALKEIIFQGGESLLLEAIKDLRNDNGHSSNFNIFGNDLILKTYIDEIKKDTEFKNQNFFKELKNTKVCEYKKGAFEILENEDTIEKITIEDYEKYLIDKSHFIEHASFIKIGKNYIFNFYNGYKNANGIAIQGETKKECIENFFELLKEKTHIFVIYPNMTFYHYKVINLKDNEQYELFKNKTIEVMNQFPIKRCG